MIDTHSLFIFGHTVTIDNAWISFREGAGPEIVTSIPTGSYSFGEIAVAVQTAMRDAGTLEWTVTPDRANQRLTIAAPTPFSLLVATGTTVDSSIYPLLGFTGSDRTSVTSATSDTMSGKRYVPQFMLQGYVPKEHFQESADATINKAASGRVEVVRFGVEKFIEMEIRFITNLPVDGLVIRNNPQGLEQAIEFLQYATTKAPFEFAPDENNPDVFDKVLLESLPGYPNGTGYRLVELVDKNLRDIYDIGRVTLRVLEN